MPSRSPEGLPVAAVPGNQRDVRAAPLLNEGNFHRSTLYFPSDNKLFIIINLSLVFFT